MSSKTQLDKGLHGTYRMEIACNGPATLGVSRRTGGSWTALPIGRSATHGFRAFEIYTFDKGTFGHSGSSSASGLDFNYGAAPDLQLTAAVPFGYDAPSDGPSAFGPGNVELAAKYKIIHQDTFGLDVSVFPRIFLPSSSQTGEPNASILLPIWVQKDWGPVSAFGGGGRQFSLQDVDRNFCPTAPPSPVRSSKRFSWVSRSFIRPQMKMGLALRHPGTRRAI
jgi:hypothetical protein